MSACGLNPQATQQEQNIIMTEFYSFLLYYVFVCVECFQTESQERETFCREGQGHQSLECCKIWGSSHQRAKESCPESVTLTDSISVKSMCVGVGGYKQHENGSVLVAKLHNTTYKSEFTKEDYVIENHTAIVCVPVRRNLRSCLRKTILPNDYAFENSGLVLSTTNSTNKKYLFDEFILNSKNEIEVCRDSPPPPLLYKISPTLSAVALLITLILNTVLKIFNNQRNFALLCNIAMLFSSYIAIIVKNILKEDYKSYLCPLFPIIYQFCSLSAFAWINIQSVIIHNALTTVHAYSDIGHGQNLKRFIYYGLYGWGIPFVITFITYIIELLDLGPTLKPTFFKLEHCWFTVEDSDVSILYYYGPLTVSLLVNLILYTNIVIVMKKMTKDVAVVNRKVYTQLLCLACKLVVVMGLVLIFKIIAWNILVKLKTEQSVIVWYYLETVVACQGLFISVVYIGNVKTMKLLWKKCEKCCTCISSSTSRNQGDVVFHNTQHSESTS